MKYLSWIGVACVALIAASCAPTVYNSGTASSSRSYDVTDFNGEWHLVTGRSNSGSDWLEAQTRFGGDDWGTTGGTSDRMRYGAWFLPDEFRIDGGRDALRIEDESGALIAELDMNDSGYRDGSYRDDRDRGVRGRWLSNRRFEVERVGRNSRRIVQTFTLENRRRQLSVSTRVERDGTTRTYTRVYDRG